MNRDYDTASAARPLALIALVGWFTCTNAATPDNETAATLSPVVVVATRTARPVAEVASTVTVVTAADLADRLAIDIADIVRDTPGVSLPRSGTRFGWDSYVIRGVGGNRVAIEIDGIPVADQFAIGSYSNAGRDVVDVGLIRRVELLYGPASALYGSDAIGGVVAYETWEPDDLVTDGAPYLSVAGGFRGDQDAGHARVTAADTGTAFGWLAAAGRRSGGQRKSSGAPADDRRDWDSRDVFGRFTWDPQPGDRLTATVETQRHESRSDLRSPLGTGRFRSTTLLTGDDGQARDRVSLVYAFSTGGGALRDGRLAFYRHATATDQTSVEERSALDLRRRRRFEFDQVSRGLEFDALAAVGRAGSTHAIGYGFELSRNRTREIRDAWQTTLTGSEWSNVVLGETFPVRDFPISRDTTVGAYLQDEISAGRWTVIPALRFDSYRLDPQTDPIYLEDNPDSDIARIDERRVSARLGAVYALDDGWSLFAQYAQGFRAPPFEDANIGLDIPLFNFRALPNPDLRSETSDGFELGVRRFGGGGEFSLTAHYTRFDDFIESRARLGTDPVSGALLFQSRNIDSTRIYGAELRYRRPLGGRLHLDLAAAWARATDRASDAPLNAVDPAEMLLRLAWRPPGLPLETSLSWTLVDRKRRIDDPDGELAPTAGFGVVDLGARYRRGRATWRAGLFNVLDQTHWRWTSVRRLPADDPTRPLLAEPGRYAGLSFLFEW